MNRETVRLPVQDGQSVAVDWYPARPGAPVAFFVPGLGSNRRGEKARYFAERFNACDWAFAAVDLRGHGDSDGSIRDLTMTGLLADVAVVAGWLNGRGACGGIDVLIGSSMGACAGAWHAVLGEPKPRAVVMIAPSLGFPAAAVNALSRAELETWRRTGLRRWRNEWIDIEIGWGFVADAARFDMTRLCADYQVPTLILHGMRDEIVAAARSVEFAARCAAPVADVVLVKAGDHRLTDQKRLLFDVLWAWLSSQPGP
jgi:alpha-beta hydrolase superfamily lysophospholipase